MVSVTVRENFSGSARKPGAISRTMSSEKTMPRKVRTVSIRAKRENTLEASSLTPSFGREFISSVKMGMNDDVSAPSPTSLRRRLDILKAVKKASAWKPAPKT